jgi:hypothetical protein
MKTRPLVPVLLVALSLLPAFGQPQPNPPPAPARPRIPGQSQPETPKLTTFSLDFPGGTPQQLVTAIEKAMNKPLNAIIPPEHADVKLPPLKMTNVSVAQLFEALAATSRTTMVFQMGTSQDMGTGYGFRTPPQNPVSDDSIWYFYVDKPGTPPPVAPVVPKVCRFYPLTSYLERGLTVDDITTAIQTGWKMLGDEEPPKISFHKETKLLIAVGDPAKLETIDAVLKALTSTSEEAPSERAERLIRQMELKRAAEGSSPPPAKPAEKPKTKN